VRLDSAAVGFAESVIVQVTLESHNDETLEKFGKALEEIPEVLEAYLISGTYD
jgi:Lrp/AsnC family leucine-responsive transcriptional regulator